MTRKMICSEVAEYASALCDGEIIPPEAAEHIGECAACQALLRDYLELGAELRRTASLEQPAPAPTRTWLRPHNSVTAFFQKGWETMRIPRFAFAVMIAGIIALASTLAVVKVGAHVNSTVVMLTVTQTSDRQSDCPLSTVDKRYTVCASFSQVNGKPVGYRIKLLSRDGDRVRLGIREKAYGSVPRSRAFDFSDFDHEPEQQVWFHPGKTLSVHTANFGTLRLSGEWMDHVPAMPQMQSQSIDPPAGELRVTSPLLIRDKQVVGDMPGGSAEANQDQGVMIDYPGEGAFVFSLTSMPGAIQAEVDMNRLTFTEKGHNYSLLAGLPLTRASHLWVLHQPAFQPWPDAKHGFITSAGLNQLPDLLSHSPVK